jgi:hypothetical protein
VDDLGDNLAKASFGTYSAAMTAEASAAPDSVQYHERRIGIIARAKIEAKFGDSADVKLRIAHQLGLKSLTTLYARLNGSPGFSIGELTVLADLLDTTVDGICSSDVLPVGADLPFRRRINAASKTLRSKRRAVKDTSQYVSRYGKMNRSVGSGAFDRAAA